MLPGYGGPLRAVIFGWAGTVIDFGARAPAGALVASFGSAGVAVTVDEARATMGLSKREQIRAIAALPEVGRRWHEARGRPIGEADLGSLFARYLALNIDSAAAHARPIAGALDVVAALRRRGVRIGSTTAYPREVMEAVVPVAAEHGFRPDALVCAGDLPSSRPGPLMCLKNMIELDVWPAAACVKVDDTLPGLAEGLNAGMWTVAVVLTGNELGLSEDELAALPVPERVRRRDRVVTRLQESGAHFVIDGVDGLLPVIDEIERRLAAGEGP